MKSGKFIVLEGSDGSGKSSQATALSEWLEHAGHRVVCCHDPGSTPLGDAVRNILLHRKELRLDPEAEMFLYMASRAQLVREVIQPALQNGDWVISDRFLMSNIVYQGHAGGLDTEAIREVGTIATCGIQPDLTLVLDIDLDTASTRMNRPLDRLESRGDTYREKVRGGYRIEAQSKSTILIDATANAETVRTQIIAATQSSFPDLLN
ncbi:MAG: dTMP kinase [Pirellulales bacterium]|jgi:dTMP kinase